MIELYCDFNGIMGENIGPLDRRGTVNDLEKLGLTIEDLIGKECRFYMDDLDDEGNEDDIMIDGIVSVINEFGQEPIAKFHDGYNYYHRSDIDDTQQNNSNAEPSGDGSADH